jgi:hypothetical protein
MCFNSYCSQYFSRKYGFSLLKLLLIHILNNCIPGRSRGYFGFGPVRRRRRRRRKLFGFRRLQTTILNGLFSYLVYTFGGLRSHLWSGSGRVISPGVGGQKPPKLSTFSYFSLCGLKIFCLIHLFCFICVE